jgi:ferredoxin-NADP reductase
MFEFETEVLQVIDRTPGVKSFRFKAHANADFKPGQFFFVTIKIDGKERTKHFSFSSSPTEKGYIEFTKRLTESDFSKALSLLKPGDWAKLKMPLGGFTFEGEYKKIAFLSGGIVITPIRSICKFVSDRGVDTDIVLLYGNSTEKDIIFKDDFDGLQKERKNIRVVYTLTSPDTANDSWNGRTGYIDADAIREDIPDYGQRIFYVCGPPGMVGELSGILKKQLGISQDKVKTENFSGYK